ncbi:MAG TPA: hypothetical protein DCZ92_07340 [Elusimicrobia bacterium]|nr:MAG: hypothetical protein A2016_02665 [Elusimicrobia bacterium GWF2_62_30]HBA60620.1 hypothetical protein [Elusimicrobiota bacterium]
MRIIKLLFVQVLLLSGCFAAAKAQEGSAGANAPSEKAIVDPVGWKPVDEAKTIVDPVGWKPVDTKSRGSAYRLSIMDFEVQSDNPQYKYLGKGFSEFISIELSRAKGMAIIDREKREEVFKEQAFNLSGAVDAKNSIEMGKMLAADYLVTGKIFDLLGDLTVTLKVVATATGEVAFEDKVTDKLTKYNYISSKCAEKIVKHFYANAQVLTAREVEKPAEAAIKFSKAVDAYDKKDFTAAKKALTEAKKLDPQNRAVNLYMDKLFTTTTKFKVMPEFYTSYENPAYLAYLTQDKAYFTQSSVAADKDQARTPQDGVQEHTERTGVGYFMPVMKGWGVGVEYVRFHTRDAVLGWLSDPARLGKKLAIVSNENVTTKGAMLSTGFRVTRNISVGGDVAALTKKREYWISDKRVDGTTNPNDTNGNYVDSPDQSVLAYTAALLVKNSASTLFFDSQYTGTDQKAEYYDTAADVFRQYDMPSVLENTLTWLLNDKRTSLVVKHAVYSYSGRDYAMTRLMPAAEQRLGKRLSLRAGAEMTNIELYGEKSSGSGFMAGGSADLGRNWTFDLNWTSRHRPSRNLNDFKFREDLIFITVSRAGILFGD